MMRIRWILSRPVLYGVTLLAIGSSGCTSPAVVLTTDPHAAFSSPDISESSGIVKSARHPGIFWTHNDSGDEPRLFAVTADGQVMAHVKVQGAENIDWEDIAGDGAGDLYLCDTGNNRGDRSVLQVYRVQEPDLEDALTVVVDRITYRYPLETGLRGPDSEACFWDAGFLFLLTKKPSGGYIHLYRLDPKETAVQVTTLEAKIKIRGLVTGADLNVAEQTLAVLTYRRILLYDWPIDPQLVSGPRIILEHRYGQSEGIAFSDGHLIITNEAGHLFLISTDTDRNE